MKGNYTYSKIILVAATAGYEIVASPNPVKDELFFKLPTRFPKSVMRNEYSADKNIFSRLFECVF